MAQFIEQKKEKEEARLQTEEEMRSQQMQTELDRQKKWEMRAKKNKEKLNGYYNSLASTVSNDNGIIYIYIYMCKY